MADRAVLFVDGNNWYHSLRDIGLTDLGRLNYSAISRKLIGPRHWTATRYYVGQVQQHGNTRLYADQRSFVARLQATDSRISVHFGRLESRTARSEAAEELLRYLNAMPVRIDIRVYKDLLAIAHRHRVTSVIVEKAVDVMLAVDMVVMAERNQFDAAYVLSADGDYTHAVAAVRSLGKKVYAASPLSGAQLAAAVDTFIRLPGLWFDECFDP
jgi:uncharacterized LabA/DUF88 family protein